MRNSRRLLLLPLLAMLVPEAASACSFAPYHRPSLSQQQAGARSAVAEATAIVDGEVIRPFVRGGPPALVRVHRTFKGPRQAEFEVGERDSCSITLTRRGERLRMLLTGGPDLYFLSMSLVSAREVDRLLRSDRQADWPWVRGVETAPQGIAAIGQDATSTGRHPGPDPGSTY